MKQRLSSDKFSSRKFYYSNRYHKATSINFFEKQIPYEKWPKKWTKINYKEYLRFNRIPFDKQTPGINIPLSRTFVNRRSERNFSSNKISFKTLQQVIYFSVGRYSANEDSEKRGWPSAGARYPIETYLLTNRIERLERFSYHYNVKQNLLEQLFLIENYKKLAFEITNQKWARESAGLIALSAVFDRSRIKYGDRGYRYCLIESGHIAQNIYLTCCALKIKCCAVGGFCDKKINDILELDNESEQVLYILAIGR